MIKILKSILIKFCGEKRYEKLRPLYRELFKLKNVLHYVHIDISGMCNLNCAMCSFQNWFDAKGLMPLETFRKLRSVLKKVSWIFLNCNAEPLLNPHIIECIKFAKSVNKKINIGFATNATLLTADLISQLLEAGLDKITISLDGATKKTYEMIRKGAKYEIVIENIKELIRQRNSSQNNLKYININTVVNKLNIHELPDILILVSELGVDSLTVNGCDVYNDEMRGNELYAKDCENLNIEYEKIFSTLRNDADKRNIPIQLPSLWAVPYDSCENHSCIVSWNGDVTPCALLSYERPYWCFGEKLIHPKIVFGNINDKDLFDIWNSGKFKRFRNDLRKGKLPHYCRNCLVRYRVIC